LARILIVDGDPASRDSLERALGDEGLDVAVAADAEAAWEAFSAFEPQVAILGRRLPRTDVEELIIRMRRAAPEIAFVSPIEPFAEMARRLRIRLGASAPRPVAAVPGAPSAGTARVLARPPVESGQLAFGSLADLLSRLWRAGADGIVALDGPAGPDWIFLLRGTPVAVHVAGIAPAVGLERGLASLCARAEGPFGFHPGSDFAADVRGERTPALAPLLAGLRLAADEPSFAASLDGCRARRVRCAASSGSVLRELALAPDDTATVAAMDGTVPVDELLRGPGRPASLLWFLLRTGGAQLAGPAEATRAAPGRLAPG
jgi:CheY-like chemotaxis protein